jgi:hypothetical protein
MKKIAVGAAAIVIVIAAAAATVYVNYGPWIAFKEKRSFINDQMKDPSSTQFRNEYLSSSGWLCGELNSKNGMGGYAGFKRFFVRSKDEMYLEGDGSLRGETTQDVIDVLNEENSILQSYIDLRNAHPDTKFEFPSKYERRGQAKRNIFEKKFKSACT